MTRRWASSGSGCTSDPGASAATTKRFDGDDDYTTPSGEQRTLENVNHVEYIGTAYLGMTEQIVLLIGTDELVTTGFTVSNKNGSRV